MKYTPQDYENYKNRKAHTSLAKKLFRGLSVMSLILLPILISLWVVTRTNVPDTDPLLNVTVHVRGDTGEETIKLIVDGEAVDTFQLTDQFAKYEYEHPYSIGKDDIKIVFEDDGLTSSGNLKGVKLDYIEVDKQRFTTKQAAAYELSDTAATDVCANASKDPTEVDCGGQFIFNIGDAGSLPNGANKQRIILSASGHTGAEIMVLQIKGQDVKQWKVKKGFHGYSYAYSGKIGDKDIRVAFINDGNTNGVNRNIDLDYIKVNDVRFEGEARSVYSTGTYTPDNGCGPGYKQKARLSCNGYMEFNIGDVAEVDQAPAPKTEAEIEAEEQEDIDRKIESEKIDTPSTTPSHDPSTHGGSNPVSKVSPGRIDLTEFDNPAVQVNYPNTPSAQLNIDSLLTNISKQPTPHRKQGQFRTRCQYSHLGYNDPIVFPGQAGVAHLHMFFGNTETDHSTTDGSLLNSGGGSCQGGELNRTAYWIPAVFDKDKNVRVPFDFVAYYKTDLPDKVEAFPVGLKMLTGTAVNTTKVKWSCAGSRSSSTEYNAGNTIPNCNNGDFVKASVGFPPCWNGQLDSANHKSHLSYGSTKGGLNCPSSHPRVLPRITYNIYWKHNGNTNQWYLSSDRFAGARSANGSTLHGDWYGGWNKSIMDTWTRNCTQAQVSCDVGPIGNGKKLKSFNKTDKYLGNPIIPANSKLQPQKP